MVMQQCCFALLRESEYSWLLLVIVLQDHLEERWLSLPHINTLYILHLLIQFLLDAGPLLAFEFSKGHLLDLWIDTAVIISKYQIFVGSLLKRTLAQECRRRRGHEFGAILELASSGSHCCCT